MQMQIIIEKFLRSEKCRLLKLKPIDKLLMFFLSSYMGKKNECWPSYPTLMADLGINDKTTLSDSIKRLKIKSIIFVTKDKGKSNHFNFNLDEIPVGNPYYPSRESLPLPVGNPYANNISNNIINNRRRVDQKKNEELRSTVQEWGPGHPGYDELHKYD